VTVRSHRPRRAARRAALAALVAAAAAPLGCIRGTLPPRELYRLSPVDTAPPAVADPLGRPPALGDATLAVAPYEAPGIYGGPSIVYRVNETEYGAYPSREWAIPLGQMLGVLTEGVLRRAPLTAGPAIFDPPSLRAQRYVWRGTVREFEEVNRGRALSAAVRIDAALLRTSDDSVVWTGSARREAPVAEPTMNAVVRTLSSLAADAVGTLAAEADSALRAHPAASARGRD
jgi:ABC-type uncharacterized transport system auxiliary subunit